MQQAGHRAQVRVALRPALRRTVGEHRAGSNQRHRLVVRHVGFDKSVRAARSLALRAEVDGVDKTEGAACAQCFQRPQVGHSRRGRHQQGERAGIGCKHPFVGGRAAQRQARHTLRAVLVGQGVVLRGDGAFGNAPGRVVRQRFTLLFCHGTGGGLLQCAAQRFLQHQRGHQVFKHRTRPGPQRGQVAMAEERPAERTPMFDGHVSLRDGKEAGQPRFTGQQVVVVAVQLLAVGLQADVQQAALAVVQRLEVHRAGQLARTTGQVLQPCRHAGQAFDGVAQVGLQRGHHVLQHPQRAVGHAAVAAQGQRVQFAPRLMHHALQGHGFFTLCGPHRFAVKELRHRTQRVHGAQQRAQAVRALACAAQDVRGVALPMNL